MKVGMIGTYPQNIYTSYDNAVNKKNDLSNSIEKEDDTQKECQTCKNRKYVDGSDEANVSFKSAAHVSPEAAGSAVRAHEGQHVSNAYRKSDFCFGSDENGYLPGMWTLLHRRW